MIILGISDPHEAAACLFVDGTLVAACAEERLTRFKCDMGYPRRAVEFCLAFAGLKGTEVDAVAFATLYSPAAHIRIKREASFSIQDWVDEQNLYWKRRLAGESVSYHEIFSNNPRYIHDQHYDFSRVFDEKGNVDHDEFRKVRAEAIAQHLNISLDRIHFIPHEECHSHYGYYGAPIRDKALVFTCEGEGDYSNATVSIADADGIREICNTKENHLAHFYRYITLLLGMKPNQHEYKVMGLAPYSSAYEKNRSLSVFQDLLQVKEGNLVVNRKIPDSYFHFIQAFQGHRFDGIAAALQEYLESCLKEWVLFHIKKTNIRNIVFSGGVAQNIKAMKAIKDMAEVESVHVNPISGDGSLAIGAGYRLLRKFHPDVTPHPINNIYLGLSFGKGDVEMAMAGFDVARKYKVIETPAVHDIAVALKDNLILARCTGRMEFGQRALGNRSILANPSYFGNVQKINRQIKRRDFWMPFTPTILEHRAGDYLVSPLKSPFMTMAFDSTELARKDLAAAIHPADFTVRPQVLEREANPPYFDLIEEFERLTGIGALLNTSFNLHGEPVVCSPEDALHTFENSDLDGLIFDDFLILRKSN
ncbi:MAG: carbamoyltransferase [Deltaproteobacteria bacterium]|nr:carbamoyltransferase [Deltaproteobacteria bacterium]